MISKIIYCKLYCIMIFIDNVAIFFFLCFYLFILLLFSLCVAWMLKLTSSFFLSMTSEFQLIERASIQSQCE